MDLKEKEEEKLQFSPCAKMIFNRPHFLLRLPRCTREKEEEEEEKEEVAKMQVDVGQLKRRREGRKKPFSLCEAPNTTSVTWKVDSYILKFEQILVHVFLAESDD